MSRESVRSRAPGQRSGGPLEAPASPAPAAALTTPTATAPAAATPLALRERLSYGLGDFASGLYWQTFTVYLTYFYTDVFGLSALAAGALLGTSRSVDALFDPLIGALADRTRSRWGKFRPYLLWLSVPLAVAGVLTFTVPGGAPGFRHVWAWVTFNLSMLLFTAINIPYTALLAVLSPSPVERTALASLRFVFAFAAGLLVSAGLLPLCGALGGGDAARGWQRCFALLGAVAALSFLITFANTRERVRPPREQASDVKRDLRALLRNGPWLVLIGFSLLSNLSAAVRGGVAVHYFKYFVGAQSTSLPVFLPRIGGVRTWQFEELVAAFNVAAGLAALGGVAVAPALARAFGRKAMFLGSFALATSTLLPLYWLRPEHVGALLALTVLGTCAGAATAPLLWSMYADTVDYAEWKSRRRATGLVFATVLFASKQGWALGSMLSLGLMSAVGFVANTEQTPESLRGLLLLMSVIPAVLASLGLLCVAFYPLDERRVAQIGRELAARRTVEAGPRDLAGP